MSDDKKRRLLRNPTATYQPSGFGWGGFLSHVIDGTPVFTWFDIPRMLHDPQVQFVLRMWRSPFQQVKWNITASSDRVKRFADETLRKLWRRYLPRLLSHYSQYGFAAGGIEFRAERGLIRASELTVVEPYDARPLVWMEGSRKGRPAGFSIQTAEGRVKVLNPHAVYFAGRQAWGPFYDMPILAGMFAPWVEKRGRNGAIDMRKSWFRKNAFSGGTLRHPDGVTNVGTDESPVYRNNQDIARETVERYETGSTMTYINDVNPAMPGEYAWIYEPGKAQPDISGIREYSQDLDKEMLTGAGIPPEVVEASEVGSGWSGRMIPLMAFYGGADELVGPLIEALLPGVRYAVQMNFGRSAWFEVAAIPLVEQVKEAAQAGPGGGEGPNPVQGAMNGQPIGGGDTRGNPVSMSFGMSGTVRRKAKRDAKRRKWQESLANELSWVRYEGDRGGKGWKNSETGDIAYQTEKPSDGTDRHGDEKPGTVRRKLAVIKAVASHVDGRLERGSKGYKYAKWAIHKAEAGMMVLMKRTQMVAVQAARERGLPETHVNRVARVTAAIDFAASFALSKGATAATSNPAIGFAAGMLPSASIAYLAYSTARNPRATLRAAKKFIKGELALHHEPAHAMSAGETDREAMVLEYFQDAPNSDWAEALLSSALDAGQPLPDAIAVAQRVLAQRPGGPRGPGGQSLSAGSGDGTPDPTSIVAEAMLQAAEEHADDPETRQAILDALAELASDPTKLKELLDEGTLLAWSVYEGPKGGKGWKNSETGRVIYGGSKPGERKERQQANVKTARELASKLRDNNFTSDDAKALADHLPALPVAELRAARQKLRAKFGGGKSPRRQQMVDALLAHVTEMQKQGPRPDRVDDPPEPKPLRGAAAANAKREDGTPHSPKVENVHTVPTGSLHTDPARFQYKVSGIGKEGVGQELKGTKKWNPELGGTLLVWRDPANGKDYVVNGHHRHELAGRTGADKMNVRYIEAKDAKTARAKGALANIAEGRGTAVDAAKYMRDTGSTPADLQEAGVSLTGKIAADAAVLTNLNPSAFQRLAEGRLSEATAVAVAKHLDDPKLQELLFKRLDQREEDGKDWTSRQVEVAAQRMANAGKVTEKGEDLFGSFEDEKSTFDQEVELDEYIGRMLNQNVNDFAAVANQKRAGRVADAGNVLAVDENQKRKQLAELAAEVFSQQKKLKGPIADVIKESAAKLATAKTRAEKDHARTEALERIRDAISREPGAAGSQPVGADAGGTQGSRPGRAEAPAPASNGTQTDRVKPKNSLYLPDKQLDVFGNAHSIPRPSPTAEQPSLIPTEVERREDVRQTEQALEGFKKASGNDEPEPAAPQPAKSNDGTIPVHELYARTTDKTITKEQVEDSLATLAGMGKAELIETAKKMGIASMIAGKSMEKARKAIADEVRDRRGRFQRVDDLGGKGMDETARRWNDGSGKTT